MKRLASFMNRKNLICQSIVTTARDLTEKMKSEPEMANIDFAECVYSTINDIAELPDQTETLVDQNLHLCFKRYVGQMHLSRRHECTRQECATYCILPVFTRFVPYFDRWGMFSKLKALIDENAHLLATEQINEAEAAGIVLHFIADLGDPSLLDAYDTLYAMAGHHGTIFNPRCKVDYKLYERLFDLFRSIQYDRLVQLHDDVDPVEFRKTPSMFLLDIEFSDELKLSVSETEGRDPEPLPDPEMPRLTFPGDPPSYNSLQNTSVVIPSAPTAANPPSTPPEDESLSYEQTQDVTLLPRDRLVTPSSPSAHNFPSAPPAEPEADGLPTYEEVTQEVIIPSVETNSPSASQEEAPHVDDELPTYEQVQEIILLPNNSFLIPSAPSDTNSPSAPQEEEPDVDDELPTYEQAHEVILLPSNSLYDTISAI